MDLVVNAFLAAKHTMALRGDITPSTYEDFTRIGRVIIAGLGRHTRMSSLGPLQFQAFRDRFEKPKPGGFGQGVNRTKKVISVTRQVFGNAYENALIDRSVRFGTHFRPPSKRRAPDRGAKVVTPQQLHLLLAGAEPSYRLRAMLLLAINAGFGDTDCATLEVEDLDLEHGVYDSRRHKTAKARRATLWPVTTEALRAVLERDGRRTGPVFVTRWGHAFVRESVHPQTGRDRRQNQVVQEFAKARKRAGLEASGITFYWLRHTFQTIGDMTGDTNAVKYMMGHALPGLGAVYNHISARSVLGLTDERLDRVSVHVHKWLFGFRPVRLIQAEAPLFA